MWTQWAQWRVKDETAAKIDAWADAHGVARNVLRAIVIAESNDRGTVNERALRSDGREDSAGILQLNSKGGQGYWPKTGVVMTREERYDVDNSLLVGGPPIARAFRAHPELGNTRERTVRTAAESGHPGDPEALQGEGKRIAERGTKAIGDVWEILEEWQPTRPDGPAIPGLGVSNESLGAAADQAQAQVRRIAVAVDEGSQRVVRRAGERPWPWLLAAGAAALIAARTWR